MCVRGQEQSEQNEISLVWTRKRGAETEIRRTRGKKRWRVHLIYVACVGDNRKVKEYSRELEGDEEKTKRKGRVRKNLRKGGEGSSVPFSELC